MGNFLLAEWEIESTMEQLMCAGEKERGPGVWVLMAAGLGINLKVRWSRG